MDRYLNAELILAAASWIVCTGFIDVLDSLLDPQRQQQLDHKHFVMLLHHILRLV
jgi:hypothetical protein